MLWSLPSCPPASGITLPHHSDLPLVPKTHHVSFHFIALQLANLLCQNAVPVQPPLPALGSFPLILWIVALKVQFSKRQSLECTEDLPTRLQHYHICVYTYSPVRSPHQRLSPPHTPAEKHPSAHQCAFSTYGVPLALTNGRY